MEPNMPVLSVIMPVYNGEQMIEQAINSVLRQGVAELEIIAVDDGSADQSVAVLTRLAREDSRLRVLTQKNAGPSAARNLGIDEARGEYLYFMDCDDWMEPGVLPGLVSLCLEHRPDLLAFGYQKDFERGGSVTHSKFYRGRLQWAKTQEELSALLPELLKNRLQAYLWNKLYRRDFVGDERFDTSVRLHEDALFNFALYRRMASMTVSDAVGYHYMQRESDSLVKQFPRQRPIWMEQMLEELAGLFRQYGVWEQNRQLVYQSVMDHIILCVRAAIAPRNGLAKAEQAQIIREMLGLPMIREGLKGLSRQPLKRELIRTVLATQSPFLIRTFFHII